MTDTIHRLIDTIHSLIAITHPLLCTDQALVYTPEPDETNLKSCLSHLFIGFRAAIPVNKKAVPALIAPALLLSVYQIFIAQDLAKESKIKRGLRKLLVKIYKIEIPVCIKNHNQQMKTSR